MIAVIRKGTDKERLELLIAWLQSQNVEVQISQNGDASLLWLTGNVHGVDMELLGSLDFVESVRSISEPFRLCSRRNHEKDTLITVGDQTFGGGHFPVIAGPCAVESEAQLMACAEAVKAAGAGLLRGGAFKPRTSPYDFQGLGDEGIRLLLKAKAATGLPLVTEIMSASQLELFQDVDVIQVGARNMQNFELLKALGQCKKPILLKRGLASTLHEWLMSAEYILSEGNTNVILCERGIRSFDSYARNTLDLTAVPALHELTHLPVVVDPSHATGSARLVPPMALAACACGADGLMLEIHTSPMDALCDGGQALLPEQFARLMTQMRALRGALRAQES